MAAPLYYLLTYLPALPAMGEPLPITVEEIQGLVEQEGRAEVLRLVLAIRLEERVEAVILARFRGAAVPDQSPVELEGFPPAIGDALAAKPEEVGEDHWLTAVWQEYYRWLEMTGKAEGSALLAEWAVFERQLREELAAFRIARSVFAAAGGKDLASVGASVSPEGPRFSDVLGSWVQSADPFVGERLLDQARWAFLEEHCGKYSFQIDEFVGYVLKLRLLNRYRRLDRARGEQILREVAGL